MVKAEMVVTYTNNSPETLTYLWLQLDQNIRARDGQSFDRLNNGNDYYGTQRSVAPGFVNEFLLNEKFDGGFKIDLLQILPSQHNKVRHCFYRKDICWSVRVAFSDQLESVDTGAQTIASTTNKVSIVGCNGQVIIFKCPQRQEQNYLSSDWQLSMWI